MSHPLQHYLDGGYQIEAVEEPTPNGPSIWAARISAMPSCVAQGATREEAVKSLEEVFPRYVRARFERGAEIPEPDLPGGMTAVVYRVVQDRTADDHRPDDTYLFPWDRPLGPNRPAHAT